MKVRALRITAVLAATMWSLGCGGHYKCGTTFGASTCTASGGGISQGGGGNNTIGVTAFVYQPDISAGGITAEALNLGNSQTYAPIPNFQTPVFSGGDGDIVAVNKKYLYLASSGSVLNAFSINATTGALTILSNSPYTVPGPALTADPQGKFLFVGGAGGIHVFTINTDGSLTAVPGSPFVDANGTPTELLTDGTGKFLYALGPSTITEYSYNATTGVLTEIAGSPLFTGMSVIASEKTGKYILGITGSSASVFVFGIGSTGALTSVTGSPFPTKLAPVWLAVHPSGALVYTFNQNNFGLLATPQPMEGYTLSASGTLTALAASPFTGLDAGVGRFDQSGEFLFSIALLNQAESMFAFGVNTTSGALSNTLNHAGAVNEKFAVTDEP